jgi:hypothetical protein
MYYHQFLIHLLGEAPATENANWQQGAENKGRKANRSSNRKNDLALMKGQNHQT